MRLDLRRSESRYVSGGRVRIRLGLGVRCGAGGGRRGRVVACAGHRLTFRLSAITSGILVPLQESEAVAKKDGGADLCQTTKSYRKRLKREVME